MSIAGPRIDRHAGIGPLGHRLGSPNRWRGRLNGWLAGLNQRPVDIHKGGVCFHEIPIKAPKPAVEPTATSLSPTDGLLGLTALPFKLPKMRLKSILQGKVQVFS
jgi:hypothetical protein